jgi:hypothetical protein
VQSRGGTALRVARTTSWWGGRSRCCSPSPATK